MSADQQALEIQLVGNSEVQPHVEGVVMGDERLSRRASVQGLKNRGLHFQKAALVQEASHERGGFRPEHEHLTHVRVNRQVGVPLTISELRIGKAAEGDRSFRTALGFSSRQRTQ